MKVLGYVMVGVCGVILGLVAGYYFIVWQIDSMEIKTPRSAPNSASESLFVGVNYGQQFTANSRELENHHNPQRTPNGEWMQNEVDDGARLQVTRDSKTLQGSQ